ncbi:arsenate reductase [Actibacterium mucosum KCTC 23349]|uniref:Arsenate reductase n=1 Tax=Actibacterium mucosum KCTC 23349 TaxID=1454373 RepID=A0A037ZLW6_9RHOB|nr:arsenate reductase [Actibacterium mucosum KCTC 23349]
MLGLKNCDTCRKALKALQAGDDTVSLQDVREAPLTEAELQTFLDAFGEALVNRRSTTWRTLSDEERTGDPLALLQAHPTLMKRPVIQSGDQLFLGWSASTKAALGQ